MKYRSLFSCLFLVYTLSVPGLHRALAQGGLDQAEAGVFDFAILDINLHGEKSYPIAFRLGSKGVRFVFASGYGDAEHPEELAHVTTLTKPYVLADIRNIAVGG